MDILEILDKIMKKLNRKEKEIIIDMFDELHNLKDENDELIDMFVNEKCFKFLFFSLVVFRGGGGCWGGERQRPWGFLEGFLDTVSIIYIQ